MGATSAGDASRDSDEVEHLSRLRRSGAEPGAATRGERINPLAGG